MTYIKNIMRLPENTDSLIMLHGGVGHLNCVTA